MMRRALLLSLASVAGLAAKRRPAEASATGILHTDLPGATVKAWNRFSRHSAEFFQLVDASPVEHQLRKQQLRDDFEAVFPLL